MWDSRAELWLPPHQGEFSYGPYIRFAGITATRQEPWENAFLAAPGLGLQAYPFSLARFRESNSCLAKILGPLRLFGEYNFVDYWGETNKWRPDHQVRVGAEYWAERHVNTTTNKWWAEFWGGLWWQSANEFDPDYDSLVFAQAVRAGIRKPGEDVLACFTPYFAAESSLTENDSYFWENKLLVGGGLRFAPSRENFPDPMKWLTRFVIFAEYLHTAAYYRSSAPSSVPDYDFRAGISFSIGEWYREPDVFGRVSEERIKIRY